MKRSALPSALLLLPLVASACRSTPQEPERPAREVWGVVDGRPASLFRLENGGVEVVLTDYGARVVSVRTPDREGRMADVVLGYDSLEEYVRDGNWFGCIAGRCANRIAGARFELDGEEHVLAANDPPHHLHGGPRGFHAVVWESQRFEVEGDPAVRLWHRSPDGEEGYPGEVQAEVVYVLTSAGELVVEMAAVTDAATPVNLVHHSYWNLAGHDSGDVLGHRLQVFAAEYTPGAPLVPTGAIEAVAGTRFDFRAGRTVAEGGYDVNYVVDGEARALRKAAAAYDPGSGRTLAVWSDQPGLQVYTGDHLDGVAGKAGAVYGQNAGLCLETQVFPDAIHHQGEDGWPSVVLRPGETYRHTMVHRFGVAEEELAFLDIGSIDINIRVPRIPIVIDIPLKPIPNLPPPKTVELSILKIRCLGVNDDVLTGDEDHIYIKRHQKKWSRDLGDHWKVYQTRSYREAPVALQDKPFYVLSFSKPKALWHLMEKDDSFWSTDDLIGSFELDETTIVPRSYAKVLQSPGGDGNGVWVLFLSGSGAGYELTIGMRVKGW